MYYKENAPLLYFPEVAGKTTQWYHSDEKKNYLKQNNPNWHYYNTQNTLHYEFNNLGYRTREIDTLGDYILVFGCSYTEGVGLFENEIWCNILGKKLGIDILNLSKSGTGPDIVNLNTQLFVKNKFSTPRAVINQWPQTTRKSFAYIEREGLFKKQLHLQDRNVQWAVDDGDLKPEQATQMMNELADTYEMMDSQWYFRRWAMEEGQIEYENSLHINSVTNLWNSLGVPVFNWTFDGDFNTRYNKEMIRVYKLSNSDRARDNAHDGPLIHKEVSNLIYNDMPKIL